MSGGGRGLRRTSDRLARTTGAARVRQNRVVLTPGVCASSLAGRSQGDGGNSASLPGESAT
ncbi:hypothetical protein EHH60_01355 [Bradyrhizobium sp. RP6]|nr:hypothetical protein EHH60_01355 [Bradyrhizobium sp. RP6]